MSKKNVAESLKSLGLKKVLAYLDSNPDKNIPKILDWIIKLDKGEKVVAEQASEIKKMMQDSSNWNTLIRSLWTDIDTGVRRKLFENFVINGSVVGAKRQKKARLTYRCNVPWAILLDPTSACNLHCIGCWAAEYGNKLNMDIATMDSIIEQGKKLGIFIYIFSGGEPLVRKTDIIKLCSKHDDCAFLAFTNGTLIDEGFADDMLRVKNFIPAISVEGFEEATDSRRGKGTYKALLSAIQILKRKRLPFGISCCYTSENTEVVGSEDFIDFMIEMGAKFAWFFTYIPVGADALVELIASAEQRAFMYKQLRAFRKTKPIFTMDFWNDGEYVGGCIAGGRRYLHINANGDIEPCAFIHYSDSSIYNKTLMEALQSPLFMQYYENQPFNANHLRPCPLLDNQGRLADMVEKSGAKSTDIRKPEDARMLCQKCEYAAKSWVPVADRLWAETPQPEKQRAKIRAYKHKTKSAPGKSCDNTP